MVLQIYEQIYNIGMIFASVLITNDIIYYFREIFFTLCTLKKKT